MNKCLILIMVLLISISLSAAKPLRVLIVADPQYASKVESGNRFFQQSIKKIQQIKDSTSLKKIDFQMVLGDVVDEGFDNYSNIINPINKNARKTYYLLGNHDYNTPNYNKKDVMKKLGMSDTYYSIIYGKWKFIVLDGTELALFNKEMSVSEKNEYDSVFLQAKLTFPEIARSYNGAISKKQINWLKNEIIDASIKKQNVVVLCHFPVSLINDHTLLNFQEIRNILVDSSCVKLFLNGHYHNGHLEIMQGLPLVTVNALVETFDTASFALIEFGNTIKIHGFGKMKSLEVLVR